MTRRIIAVVILSILAVAAASAQRIWSGYYGSTPPKFPSASTFTGSFNFCRLMFTSDRREKRGWDTDYPGADLNFSTRFAELTKADVKMDRDGEGYGIPDAVVVRATDDAMFQCPFILMEDAGTVSFSPAEVSRLGAYFRKGGFLLVSDYHGEIGKEQFDEEIGRALPASEFHTINLTPDHPMWHSQFTVKTIPQMASIQTWRRTGGDTIERWNFDRRPPSARGIVDDRGHVAVVMLHNTDIPDGWEREGEDPQYFYRFSPDSYAVAIDVMLYEMSH